MDFNVAIDGPAASGKSTVARRLALRLGGYYLNTGDMYRAVTWFALRRGVDPEREPDAVERLLPEIDLRHEKADDGELALLLDGRGAAREEIRAPAVGRAVSHVAMIPAVREWAVERQRRAAALGGVVMEGRDIGTVVLPEARYKFFLTASPEVRARRRLAQRDEAGPGATVASVAAEIAARDRIDSTREVAPLRPAADAAVIDTGAMQVDEVVDVLLTRISQGDTDG